MNSSDKTRMFDDFVQFQEECTNIHIELVGKIKWFQEIFKQEKPKTMEENISIINTPAGIEMVDYFRRAIRSRLDVRLQLCKLCAEELILALDNENMAFLLYKDLMESFCEEHKKIFDPKALIKVFVSYVSEREDSIAEFFLNLLLGEAEEAEEEKENK